jgi:phytoene dehydrogenase-like protein
VDQLLDAIVIGSGPNGLAAAVALARAGRSVVVYECADDVGGGTRSAELTLPGFVHDVCSAVHPMGILSPFFRTLPLEDHGLVWLKPPASVAHPLDDGPAVMIYRSLDRTAAGLGADGSRYAQLVGPFLDRPHELLADVMAPLRMPAHPIGMLRFGVRAIFSANRLARLLFRGERARALFAGCAGTRCCRSRSRSRRRSGSCSRSPRTSRTGRSRRAGRMRSRARSRRISRVSVV